MPDQHRGVLTGHMTEFIMKLPVRENTFPEAVPGKGNTQGGTGTGPRFLELFPEEHGQRLKTEEDASALEHSCG